MSRRIRLKLSSLGPIFAIDALSPTGLLGFGGCAIRTPWVEGYPIDEGALEAALRANVVVGASQKGLMCPPGPGFCAADSAAMAVVSPQPAPAFSLGLGTAQQRPGLPQIKGT